MQEHSRELVKRLKMLKSALQMTWSELASQLGVSKSWIDQVLYGTPPEEPRPHVLRRIEELEAKVRQPKTSIQMLELGDLKLRVAALERRMTEVVEILSRLGTPSPAVKLMEEGHELREPPLREEEKLPED